VLGKTRATLLAAAALIILTAALCVLSTLMGGCLTGGAICHSESAGGLRPYAERLLCGGSCGFGRNRRCDWICCGIGIAAWIGRVNFHAPVAPRFSVLPIVLAGSIVVTLLSAILPISLLLRVQPAVILRESEMIQIKDVTKLYPAKAAAPLPLLEARRWAASARRTERFMRWITSRCTSRRASGFPSWDRRVRVNRRW